MKIRTDIKDGDCFHHLTFSGRMIHHEDRRWCGEFVCDCGNIKVARIDLVVKGQLKSCGCQSSVYGYKERIGMLGNDYPFYVLHRKSKKSADQRRIEFKISPNDIRSLWKQQEGRCFYTGRQLVLPRNFVVIDNPEIASIDRINSSIGYTPSNISLTLKVVNMMKCTLTHADFVYLCNRIAEKFAV